MDIWPYLWIACMLGLVIATSVVAMREKKAREAAMQKLKPKSLPAGDAVPMVSSEDGFAKSIRSTALATPPRSVPSTRMSSNRGNRPSGDGSYEWAAYRKSP